MKRRTFHHLRRHCLVALTLIALAGAFLAGPATAEPGTNNASDEAILHRTSGNAGTSGDVSSPQPNSTADDNGVGANNDPGPYTSTRDGSPSGNGNGTGAATGEPCAGCVGKADNKNPSGQLPGPSDHNAGYECDTNQGIAHTNPAHTGCSEVSGTVTPPCDTATTNCAPCDTATTNCAPCDTATTNCAPCVASASNNFCSDVLGEEFVRSPSPAAEVLGTSISRTEATNLAATGIDVGGLVVIALGLVLGGTLMIALARRSPSVTQCVTN